MWFEKITGFTEETPEQVRSNLILDGEYLISTVNGRKFRHGRLEILTLNQLKASVPQVDGFKGSIKVSEVFGDVRQFHQEEENRGALFQVASQFNLLEMIGPHIKPEMGVDIYEQDHSQGPACAIACGAGTIYRNYFVKVNNKTGQSSNNQINCLEEVGKFLKCNELKLWNMENGYVIANEEGLSKVTGIIGNLSKSEYEDLKGRLKIGMQWNTEVTLTNNSHIVSQAYCAALPIAYSNIDFELWEAFAILILEATYEATFYAALRNFIETKNDRLFITLVGGGAFGNKFNWIYNAIDKAVNKFKNTPLDIRLVKFRSNEDFGFA